MGAAAVPIIGGIFQAGGALSEAQDKAWALEDEANAASRSAKIARQAGAYNAERQKIVTDQTLGGIRADYAASGIAQDSGSVLDVLRDSHTSGEMDRLNILYGAESKAQNLEEHARAAMRGASGARQAGTFNAFGALFGAGAKAASYSGGSGAGGSGGGGGGGYGTAGGSYSDFSSTA